jgi:hypothetical protein
MKTLLKIFFTLFILQFTVCISVFAQNLVPNPSFEEYYTCPDDCGQTICAKKWKININTADYFNICCTDPSLVSIPNNAFGYQNAANGNAYFGILSTSKLFGNNVKEFFGCKLITSLTIGQKYYMSFKVNLSNTCPCAINNIGVLFTNAFDCMDTIINGDTFCNAYLIVPPTPLIKNFAHINSTQIITDTADWTTISGSFIADSSYKIMLFGNFFDYSLTDTLLYSGNSCGTYHYIDDICLSSDSLYCNETFINQNTNALNCINIYPNPCNKFINIENNYYKNYKIKFFNITGQLMLKKDVNNKKQTIDLTNFNSGIYFIKLLTGKEVLTKKLVILK